MDNRINEIRRQIRALRISMLEAEEIMREQIKRDEDCAFVAGDILRMRVVMSRLVEERTVLGDHEPILVSFASRQPRARKSVVVPLPKRHLVFGEQRAR
ncbi:hypothetical protein MTX26_14220 [Bradyrhizobium sp. ISRA443]|uniref:hypothetical protein n=1 Tax=unclassified Bradyrhizobium TaxID=2631580 RepID=UPI002479DEE8|nr:MULTISPECIES: hypothetical protein [unclassified Bradyrhizobium]WGR91591.1 hypothetical protein MTX20_24735 [Bradyrhizobium sp. ISRA435]WGS01896.1 hypothetical protein MTX23_14230 [Bradyrhizobium sp. ISRA436]WGS08782.1 hypothetical protein MTX18_14220 [Bradyrhizobium sp. ISRA437]WGS15670.1 hypothetical protein MTX26_14220 [Bradyrhizobium sp. ISRA443]